MEIRAPISGTIWRVFVDEGQAVERDQVVAIIESMKLEIPVEASTAGVVRNVLAVPDATVNDGDLLFVIE